MPAVAFLPLIAAGVQTAAAQSAKDNTSTVPFMDISAGRKEKLANHLEKDTWNGLIQKYRGAPVHVLDTASQMRSGYPASEAMAQVPEGGAYSGAMMRAMDQGQDTNAQGVNANTGQALHAWALGGKMAQGQRRQQFNQSMDKMRLAYKLNQTQAMQAAQDRVNASLNQLGRETMSTLGSAWPAPTTPSVVPHDELSQPAFGEPTYTWQKFAGARLTGGSSPSTPYWGDWSFAR